MKEEEAWRLIKEGTFSSVRCYIYCCAKVKKIPTRKDGFMVDLNDKNNLHKAENYLWNFE